MGAWHPGRVDETGILLFMVHRKRVQPSRPPPSPAELVPLRLQNQAKSSPPLAFVSGLCFSVVKVLAYRKGFKCLENHVLKLIL